MADTQCPVCNGETEEQGRSPTRGTYDVRCPRCGGFSLTGTAKTFWEFEVQDNDALRPVVSHYIRRRNRGEEFPTIESRELQQLTDHPSLPTAQEQADNLVRWLGNNTRPGNSPNIVDVSHGAIIGSAGQEGFVFVVRGLMRQGLLEEHQFNVSVGRTRGELTFDGWQRYEELKKGEVSSSAAFMAMPFAEDTVRTALEECFRPAVSETGFILERLDDQPQAGLIDDHLRVAIQSCRFLISDVTHDNSGAYWEAGYAEGLGKPVIYTCEESVFLGDEGPHFDTNHHLTVVWNAENFDQAADRMKATIRATIPEATR